MSNTLETMLSASQFPARDKLRRFLSTSNEAISTMGKTPSGDTNKRSSSSYIMAASTTFRLPWLRLTFRRCAMTVKEKTARHAIMAKVAIIPVIIFFVWPNALDGGATPTIRAYVVPEQVQYTRFSRV